MYIFGSIHRPYTSVWPHIPRNVKRAFKSSKKIYFEVDLTSYQYLTRILKCQYLPNQQTLKDILPQDVFRKLQNYLNYIQTQVPDWLDYRVNKDPDEYPDEVFEHMMRHWERKRPIWILLQLATFRKELVQTRSILPLDSYMFYRSQKAGKSVGHLESPEEHCGINNLNSNQVC